MSLLETVATVFGVVSGLANFPQAYKIFRRKSALDISITTYVILFVGAIAWTLYGVEIGNFPVTLSNFLGTITVGLVVVGWFLYGRETHRQATGARK